MTSTLSHLLLEAADAHPDRPAIWSSTGELTYAELCDRSMRLARALVEHGIEPGDRVVIALPKDVALPVAIFGTLLAGGAYVPIDYLTPPARAHVIAADAEPVAVISGSRTMQAMVLGDASPIHDGPSDNPPALHWLGRGWFDPDRSPERQPVSVRLSELQQRDQLRSPVEVPASALAYILYTSGSTGRPKGVAHTHASALAFVRWAVDAVGLKETDVVSQHASPSFDLSVFDFFGAAMAAARLALVPASTFGRVSSLCRFIVATGVTVWYSVPSALLRASGAESLALLKGSALRQIIFAGEEIPAGPLRVLWHNLPPSCRVANWYGPTETNVCTFHDLTALDVDGGEPIPIGMPCPYAEHVAGSGGWRRHGERGGGRAARRLGHAHVGILEASGCDVPGILRRARRARVLRDGRSRLTGRGPRAHLPWPGRPATQGSRASRAARRGGARARAASRDRRSRRRQTPSGRKRSAGCRGTRR